MSEVVSIEDTAILIWCAICSVYTTILTATAIGVVYIFRKRRSSILKIQRPPRTPFSELEFNVATPTDTVKSRRVSFSRRTGVAEFVTNEATTTWKNFYEEHNKSLESSGNDSGANATRQPIGHLGKRIFEQQFEEVEAVDFITSLDNLAARNINSTINVNFTEQLASIESAADKNLAPPKINFELSAFTDHHSKLFTDDLAVSMAGEMSGRIDVNFSAVQSLNVNDDLDEIQRDLQRRNNAIEPVQFRDVKNFSEYIEIELDTTHVAHKNEESDMSITETIRSPKVNISKTSSPPDKKCSLNWIYDKENCPGDLKAKSLIFDNNDMSITTALQSKVDIEVGKQQTMIFDCVSDLSMTKPIPTKMLSNRSIVIEKSDSNTICSMRAEDNTSEKRKTIIFEDGLGDLSITKPIPAKLLSVPSENEQKPNLNDDSSKPSAQTVEYEEEKCKTVLFEDNLGNLSMTKPIPAHLLSIYNEIIDKSVNNVTNLKVEDNNAEKRKTILFEDGLGDLSMTKPIPAKLLSVHSESEEKLNLKYQPSTQTVVDGEEKCKTILFENDLGDLSMTKPIPVQMLSIYSEIIDKSVNNMTCLRAEDNTAEKRKTILFEDGLGDLSMTKPIPAKLLSVHSESEEKIDLKDKPSLQTVVDAEEKCRTILFEDDLGNLSMTKPIPANLLPIRNEITENENFFSNTQFNKSNLQFIRSKIENSRTEDDDLQDISMTGPTSSVFLLDNLNDNKQSTAIDNKKSLDQPLENIAEKRKTILFDDGDISMTRPIETRLLSTVHSEIINTSNKNYNHDYNENESKLHDKGNEEKENESKLHDKGEKLTSISISNTVKPSKENDTKNESIIFDDGDLSMTKPIPNRLLSTHSEIIDKSNTNENFDNHRGSVPEHKRNENRFEIVLDEDDKLTCIPISEDVEPKEKCKSIIFDVGDAKPITTKLLSSPTEKLDTNYVLRKPSLHKSQTIVDDNNEMIADMSIDMQKDLDNSHKPEINDILEKFITTKTTPAPLLSDDNVMINASHGLLAKNHTINLVDKISNENICKPIISMDLFKTENVEAKHSPKKTELSALDFSNFKSQDVVVYQVTTNESSKEQRDISEDYHSEQGDVKVVQSIDNRNNDLDTINRSEDHVKEEKSFKDEKQKLFNKSENREEIKDISRNASMCSEVGNQSLTRTLSKKSFICDLLDMSKASIASGLDDKDVTANITLDNISANDIPKHEMESVTSEMFYITKDTDSETRPHESRDAINFTEKDTREHLSHEFHQSECEPQNDTSVQNISEVKESYEDVGNSLNTRDCTKVRSANMSADVSAEFAQNNTEISRRPKSISEVDNTKQLLDMLSDLTDGHRSISSGSPLSLTCRGQMAIENKTAEPKRVSIAPNRQSIVLSREDLMSNISMAQAALQRSIAMDDSDEEEPITAPSVSPPKKSVRVSNEVVKTLHFEDESTSEFSVRSDLRTTLRKVPLEDISYQTGRIKANVIPSYLKDVSDGIKSLMIDLVKPMRDDMPYEAVNIGESVKKTTSTCSTQIQTNLYTSSQIDLNTNEIYSNSDMFNVEKNDNVNRNTLSPQSTLKSVSFIGSDVYAHSDLVSRNLKDASFRPTRLPPNEPVPGKVLLFDHMNPLNNVLLTPTEYTEVHKYSPSAGSQETLGGSDKSHSAQSRGNDYNIGNVTVPFNVQYNMGCQSGTQENISSHPSVLSNISKPLAVDQAVGVKITEVKDIEVNTAIIMKKNKELLETSSSLTLVDDDLVRASFNAEAYSEVHTKSVSNVSESNSQAPLRVIYKLKRDVSKCDNAETIDSDMASNDEDVAKAKKRSHSPGKTEKHKNSPQKQNVTPKPNAKVQKLSDTPHSKSYSLKRTSGNKSIIERYFSSAESKMDVSPCKEKDATRKRSPRKKLSPKKGTSIMVQQLLTEFNVRQDVDQKNLNKQILEALSRTDSSAAPDSVSECERSVELVSSFTSSKNQYKARPSSITMSTDSHCELWSAENAKSDCDASVNVVARIDMLPFMGSHECEWASSGTDAWCFQLLHGRLRLVVRLAHRHHNSTRTRVRGDTPVLAVTVHQSHHNSDLRNSVAMSCITFACAALRWSTCACTSAGAVPALLRRAAGVARRALTWGRAMHDARVHLAYTLSDDQKLVLKVANIPMRCVWEVTMKLVLTREEPWPQATDVQVTRVLDARACADRRLDALLAAVPRGWAHVPDTVWTLFKYLKHKGTAESSQMIL
ncbi:uncharacterized protein LOC128682511 isoform X2 [Plodia interpunctella]|uniref:uncharacterized protein LOC128682511 isoform X2 n=1 Tax=Plodia interpunctella TaxID=58824 RepID=UPI00236811DE|nr:uncharacterized protein LOC128682511 isoform X2 [Plodia interpunctella]